MNFWKQKKKNQTWINHFVLRLELKFKIVIKAKLLSYWLSQDYIEKISCLYKIHYKQKKMIISLIKIDNYTSLFKFYTFPLFIFS